MIAGAGYLSLLGIFRSMMVVQSPSSEGFGFTFTGHPYLENLYLPTYFEGFPLRKDFPLLSRRVKPWPGIVDVEPMPGGDDDDEAEGADAADGGDG